MCIAPAEKGVRVDHLLVESVKGIRVLGDRPAEPAAIPETVRHIMVADE